MTYRIELSEQADTDLVRLAHTIKYEFVAPLTSFKYIRELKAVIKSLETNPERNAVRDNHFLLQFDTNVRRVNYKKMAIIYTNHNDLVYIHRIMAGALL